MIEGLKFRITSKELRARLATRVKYHEDKAKAYDRQVKALKGSPNAGTGHSSDPTSDLLYAIKEHSAKADRLAFLRDHVVPDEIYELSAQDQIVAELLERI